MRHEMIIERRGGQTRVVCRCACMPELAFNHRAEAEREYRAHVERAERLARRP